MCTGNDTECRTDPETTSFKRSYKIKLGAQSEENTLLLVQIVTLREQRDCGRDLDHTNVCLMDSSV